MFISKNLLHYATAKYNKYVGVANLCLDNGPFFNEPVGLTLLPSKFQQIEAHIFTPLLTCVPTYIFIVPQVCAYVLIWCYHIPHKSFF